MRASEERSTRGLLPLRHRVLSLLACACVALSACGEEDGAPEREREADRVEVRVRRLSSAHAPQRIAREARLQARADILLRAEAHGRIVAWELAEGEGAQAGTPLLRLEDREERALLDALHARLAHLLSKAWSLADRRVLEREIAAAEERLAERQLLAPCSGRLVAFHREVGEWVSPGEALARWISDGPLTVTLDLLETEVARIAREGEVRVALARQPEHSRAARITRLAPAAESGGGRFLAEVEISGAGASPAEPPFSAWLPGSLARVSLPLRARATGFPLEGDALRMRYGLERVLVVTGEGADGRVEERVVSSRDLPGQPGLRLVTSGLKSGARVVIRGALGLEPGSPVRIVRILEGPL